MKFKFAFILSFKLYTDGDCIKKNYAQQALTDCKPFNIRNSTRYFFELEEIKGLGKKLFKYLPYTILPNLVNIANF